VLERSIRDAFLGVQLGVSQISAYTQAVLSAEINLNSTERAYELGSRTTSDILIAQENLINAQVNLENVKKDYLENTFKLKALTGTLNADDLIALNNELN
jgi:outer membrane protein